MYTWNDGTYLAHHGIKGQKWGERRFQNDDGSLTPAGRERYGYGTMRERVRGAANGLKNAGSKAVSGVKSVGKGVSNKWNSLSDNQKKAIKIGAAVAVTALAAYGAHKYVEATKNKAFAYTMQQGNRATDQIMELARGQANREWGNQSEAERERVRDLFGINHEAEDLRRYLNEDTRNKAHANSRTFRQARRTLKGDRQLTVSELERADIRTGNPYISKNAQDALDYYRNRNRLWDL